MQCRACMGFNCIGGMDMSYVVSTDGKTLYDYFNDCTQLKATSKDDLPKMLCINCTQNLQQAYHFRQEARRSDEELKQILTLANNETALVCESNVQSEVIEDIEDSTFYQLSLSPKKETTSFYPEHSNGLEDIEIDPFDLLAAPTKVESSLVYEPTEQSEVLEDVVQASTVDPLSASGHSGQNETKSLNFELSILKEEINKDLFTDVFDDSNSDQFDESTHDDKEDSDHYELRRRTNFTCDLCVYTCSGQNEFKKHIFALHKDTIICHKCCKVFELPNELQLHKKFVHDTDSDMCCPWCKNSNLMPNDELTKHMKVKHKGIYLKYFPRLRMLRRGENDPFECELCQRLFTSIYELADHIQEHKFDCPLCSMSFKRSRTYRCHIKRIHNQSVASLKSMLTGNDENNMEFHCSLCTKQFKLKTSLQKHVKSKHKEIISNSQNDINSKDNQGSADNIDINSKDQDSADNDTGRQKLIADIEKSVIETEVEMQYETDGLIECKYCHKKIPRSGIIEHEKRHFYRIKMQRKYICSYCSREFNSQKSVKLHEKNIHVCDKSERKECPICHKDVDASYLKTHLAKVHASERKFACEICGDLFKYRSLLYSHKQLHLYRKFPCSVCNKGFISASELKIHMRMHTGEQPYACHLCDQRFKLKGRLNYHLQRHAGIKRKCNVCDKEFNCIEQLRIHSYKHTGMPYRCSVCDYQCVKRELFIKHLLHKHDKTMTVDELFAMFKANTGRWPRVRIAKDLETMDEVMTQDT